MALPLPQGGAAVQKTVLNEGCPVTTLGTAEPSAIGSAETPDPTDRSARGSHRETPWLCGHASVRGEPWDESARPDSGTSCRDRKRLPLVVGFNDASSCVAVAYDGYETLSPITL